MTSEFSRPGGRHWFAGVKRFSGQTAPWLVEQLRFDDDIPGGIEEIIPSDTYSNAYDELLRRSEGDRVFSLRLYSRLSRSWYEHCRVWLRDGVSANKLSDRMEIN